MENHFATAIRDEITALLFSRNSNVWRSGVIVSVFLFLNCATIAQSTVQEWQQEAVKRYPELAIKDSPLNRLFVLRYEQLRKEEPPFFSNPNWPMRLATRCNIELQRPKAPEPTPSPSHAQKSESADTNHSSDIVTVLGLVTLVAFINWIRDSSPVGRALVDVLGLDKSYSGSESSPSVTRHKPASAPRTTATTTTTLRDKRGFSMGTVTTDVHGVQTLRNKTGHRLGSYNPSTDTTTDRLGYTVGRGNLLAMLIDD